MLFSQTKSNKYKSFKKSSTRSFLKESQIKKLEAINRKRLIFIVLIVVILFIIITTFLVKYLVGKEINKIRQDINKTLLQTNFNSNTLIIDNAFTSPDISSRLQKTGITRYYLSELEEINNHYVPKVYLCLFENGQPIYPRYIYETWSQLNYPNDINPKVSLMKFILLPDDNNNFKPDKNCFIKEIVTEKDWQMIKEKYGFTKESFM